MRHKIVHTYRLFPAPTRHMSSIEYIRVFEGWAAMGGWLHEQSPRAAGFKFRIDSILYKIKFYDAELATAFKLRWE